MVKPVISVDLSRACALVFYSNDEALQRGLQTILADLGQDRPWLAEQVSVTLLRYSSSLMNHGMTRTNDEFWSEVVPGASCGGSLLRYPASTVKLAYMAALEAWYADGLLHPGGELEQACQDMIRHSSNDATALVVDVLSGTTGGPGLDDNAYDLWVRQRQLVNRWLQTLGWPEWQHCNCLQKTWSDGPYGREHQLYGPNNDHRNRLSTDALARLMHSVMAGVCVSPVSCARMQKLLRRSIDPKDRAVDPLNQVDGFLGEALPPGGRLWSKAGLMSTARGDVAYVEPVDGQPMLVAVLAEGKQSAADSRWLPQLMRALLTAAPSSTEGKP